MAAINAPFQFNSGRILPSRCALTGSECDPRHSGKVLLVIEKDVRVGNTSFLTHQTSLRVVLFLFAVASSHPTPNKD